MKKNSPLAISALLVFILLAAIPHAGLAAVGITSVSPGFISFGTPTTITITGTEFENGSVASLETYGELTTTYINANTLTAFVPGDVPAGTYTLRVDNPGGNWATLFSALTITQAAITPENTAQTPVPTHTQQVPADSFYRPIIVIDSYSTNKDPLVPGENFNLTLKLYNQGRSIATNVIAIFTVGDFIPQGTGGVVAVREIDPGETKKIEQPMASSFSALAGKTITTLTVTISYDDADGIRYTETFNVAINLKQVYSGVAPSPTPTPTPEVLTRPLLVITDYRTSVSPLQPGSRFSLSLQIQNLGDAEAKRVSMIVGGGTITTDPSGTPSTGGVSGASGDLANFAPIGSSNVQYLGDIPISIPQMAEQELIVNVTTNPGAYPLKISFIYTDDDGMRFLDDQVVTLLVYSNPVLDINFYRDPGPFFAGQPNMLPIQVVNLGRKSAVLGNLRVTADNSELSNSTVLIGSLEAGGYFTLDAMLIPFTSGPLELTISVDYSDDFNQSQVVTKIQTIEILEEQIFEPPPGNGDGIDGPGGPMGPSQPNPETFWQRVIRFLRGLFGLDSAQKTDDQFIPGGMPPVEDVPFMPVQ
jgi:hypothetical protein